MIRVAIYVRLSDEDEIKRNDESESIINQKMMLTNYAISQGWHIVEIYVDEDYSGADVNRYRPGFEKLIKDAQNKCFDVVLCKTQARFTRDMEVFERYVHNKFPEWGIRFVTTVDRVDTADKGNKKSRQINGLVNEWFLEDLSNDIKNTLRKKMENGQFIGSWASYGYKKSKEDSHKLIIDEEAADVVRMIFRLYINGYGVTKIIKILNEKGIDTPSVYMRKTGENFPRISKNDYWSDASIYRILKNEVYIGTLTQGKLTTTSYKNSKLMTKGKNDWVVIKNNHESIIDIKDFYIVQNLLSSKRRTMKYDNSSDNIGKAHLFAGKAKCFECGGPMVKTVMNNGKGKKYSYLRCKNHNMYAGEICKHPNMINYDTLINVVEDELRSILNDYLDRDNVINAASKGINVADYSNVINKLNKEISNINNQIDIKNKAIANLYVDKANDIIDSSKFFMILNVIEEDIKKLLDKKDNLNIELSRFIELENIKTDVNEVIKQFNINNGITYQIVQETIDYINIGIKKEGTRDITIHWKI